MTSIGIDLGGTKIEAQVFDDAWSVIDRKRCDTPPSYSELVVAVAEMIGWAEGIAGGKAPVGIGAAGLINPETGLALTANLAATGKPLPSDIERAAGRPVTYINDCRALALSESVFGKGKGHQTVLAVILGTGVGGGIAVDGAILRGPTRTGGEFGHTSAPAHIVAQHNLPILPCGCGRQACIEIYVSGPGLTALAKHITGQDVTPHDVAAERQGEFAKVWHIWCDLTADLIHSLTLTVDPDIIVLGGGLSQIDGLLDDLGAAASRAQIGDFSIPLLALAQGGETSGARGAAYAAWQSHKDATP